MPLRLTDQEQEEIFYQIKKAFSDFQYFDLLIAAPLRLMIQDSTRKDFGVDTAKSIMKDYVDMSLYQNEKQKEELKKVEQILTASHVLLHSKSTYGQAAMWSDANELLREYPDFESVRTDPKELQYLLNFRNFMAVALTLLTASGNKIFLLRVIERLEGSGNEYITGSGQKISVTRRIAIYEKEGKVKSKKTGKKEKSKDDMPTEEAADPPAKKQKTKPTAHDPTTVALPIAVPTDLLLGPTFAELDNILPGTVLPVHDKAEDLLLGLSRLPTGNLADFPNIPTTNFTSEQELKLARHFSDGFNDMTTEEEKALQQSL
jgi:hypothetical protein